MSDLWLELVQSVIELISLSILGLYLCLQLSHLSLTVILQLLFVFLELYELVVEHFNLLLLGSKHILMVTFQSIVVHFSVALVAYAVRSGIILSQLTFLVAAWVTYGSTAPLAVLLNISMDHLQLSGKWCLTQHTCLSVKLTDGSDIEWLWQARLVEQSVGIRIQTFPWSCTTS